MNVKVAMLTIILFNITVVVAAYIERGYWAFGLEWALPVVMAAVIPLKEEEDVANESNESRD